MKGQWKVKNFKLGTIAAIILVVSLSAGMGWLDFVDAAMAQAAQVPADVTVTVPTGPAPTVTIDTKGLLDALFPYIVTGLGGIITVICGTIAVWLKQKWNIDADAKHLHTFEVTATNVAAGIVAKGLTRIEANGKIVVPDNVLDRAAKTLIEERAPDAVTHLGIDQEVAKDRIVEKIQQIAGIPTAIVMPPPPVLQPSAGESLQSNLQPASL